MVEPAVPFLDLLKEGWLTKRSRFLKQWRKRWCILTMNELLTYENEEKDKPPTEIIPLKGMYNIYEEEENGFSVVAKKEGGGERKFQLKADSKQEQNEWIDGLRFTAYGAEIMVIDDVQETAKLFVHDSVIVWHDPNVHSNENVKRIPDLQDIAEVKTFTDWQQALNFVQGTPLFCHVITSGTNGELLVKEVSKSPRVSFISVFCTNVAYHNEWAKNYKKVICVEDTFKNLTSKINQSVMKWQRESSALRVNFPAFAPIFDDKDISEINHLHIYLQGFLKYDQRIQSKRDFLALGRAIYKDKSNMEIFKKTYYEYDMESVLTWYTKESFVYKTVNNCLRIATSSSIQYCRLVLGDLERAIKEYYERNSKYYSGLLYRGTYISAEEWKNLQVNVGKDIEMFGFLSTSKSKETAVRFTETDMDKKVFVTIIIPGFPEKGEQGFAEVSKFSKYPTEEEVLFNVRSRFTILEATNEMIGGKDCRHLVLVYGIQAMRRYMRLKTPQMRLRIKNLNQMRCKFCKVSALKVVCSDFSSENSVAVCLDCLKKNNYENITSPLFAIAAPRASGEIEIVGMPIQYQQKDLKIEFYGHVCSVCKQKKPKQCWKCITCAAEKRTFCQNCFKNNNECLQKSHSVVLETNPFTFWFETMSDKEYINFEIQKNIFADVVDIERQPLSFYYTHDYKRAIKYYETYLKENGPGSMCINLDLDWTDTYSRLGISYYKIGKYKEATKNLKLACNYMLWNDKHPATTAVLNNLGLGLYKLGEYSEALKVHLDTLKLSKEMFGENHTDVARSYNNLGLICDDLKKHDIAMQYHLLALDIEMHAHGSGHPLTALSHTNLGLTYDNMGEHQKAMDCHLKALEIFIAAHGEKHPDTAHAYNNLGLVYYEMKLYDKSLEVHHNALEIRKAVHGDKHPATGLSYNNLRLVYGEVGQFEKAKEFELKAEQVEIEIDDNSDDDLEDEPKEKPKGHKFLYFPLERYAEPLSTKSQQHLYGKKEPVDS